MAIVVQNTSATSLDKMMPLLRSEQTSYSSLVDHALKLEKERAQLIDSDAKMMRDVRVAQEELQKQALARQAGEAQVAALQDNLRLMCGASHRQDAEISRLKAELAASRSEAEVLRLDLNAAKALGTQREDQLAITQSELDRRNADVVKLRIEAERWQARAEKAESEWQQVLNSLKKSEELMYLKNEVLDSTNDQLNSANIQLSEVRNRELTSRVKLERAEREHQEWIRRAKLLDETLYTPRGTSLARSKLLSAQAQADSLDKLGFGKLSVR